MQQDALNRRAAFGEDRCQQRDSNHTYELLPFSDYFMENCDVGDVHPFADPGDHADNDHDQRQEQQQEQQEQQQHEQQQQLQEQQQDLNQQQQQQLCVQQSEQRTQQGSSVQPGGAPNSSGRSAQFAIDPTQNTDAAAQALLMMQQQPRTNQQTSAQGGRLHMHWRHRERLHDQAAAKRTVQQPGTLPPSAQNVPSDVQLVVGRTDELCARQLHQLTLWTRQGCLPVVT